MYVCKIKLCQDSELGVSYLHIRTVQLYIDTVSANNRYIYD